MFLQCLSLIRCSLGWPTPIRTRRRSWKVNEQLPIYFAEGCTICNHRCLATIRATQRTHSLLNLCNQRDCESLALIPQMVQNVAMTDGRPNYPDAVPPSASALKLTTSHGIQSKEGGRRDQVHARLTAYPSYARWRKTDCSSAFAIRAGERDEEEEICNVHTAQAGRAALHRPLYAIAAICGLLSGERLQTFLAQRPMIIPLIC